MKPALPLIGLGLALGGVLAFSGDAKAAPGPDGDYDLTAYDKGFQDAFTACAGGKVATMDDAKAAASGSAKAYADGWADGCKGAKDGTVPVPDKGEMLPGTTTLKARVRTIDASTGTPGQFAAKYSGTAGRWKEIADANPTGTIYPGSPAIKVATWSVLDVDPNTGETLATGKDYEGLQPWTLGQLVKLPDGWAG